MSSFSSGVASPAPAAPLGRRDWVAYFLVFVLCVGPTLVWPADGQFVQDEPRLLAMAWHANHDHRLATIGLYGNFAVPYGPFATQVYQALLLVSHDPAVVEFLHALLCAGSTTAALLWLARTLGFSPCYVLFVSLLPRMWQFQRIMWDASFAIPVGALAVAALAANLRAPTRGKLLIAIAGALLVPLIHPQGLPLCGALGVTLLWKCRPELRRHRAAVGLTLAGLLVFNGVYIVRAIDALTHRLGGSVQHGYPQGPGHLQAALAPFMGGTLLGDFHFTGVVTAPGAHAAWWHAVAEQLVLVFAICWLGIAVIFARLWSQRRANWGARETIGSMVLLCLLLQALLFGLMRIPASPQYFFGTFGVHALLPWYALEIFPAGWFRRFYLIFVPVCGGLVIGHSMVSIHRYGFNPDAHSLTIGDTKAVALGLNQFSDETALTNEQAWRRYPQSLRAMRLLLPPAPGTVPRASGHLYLVGELDTSIPRLKVRLAEAAPGPDEASPLKWSLERDFEVMNITPLPKDWVPDPSTW